MDLFDYYMFTISYPPTLCCTKSPSFCESKGVLKVHGLWPSSRSTKAPTFCKSDSISLVDRPKRKMSKREEHQWAKHGTCSTLAEASYFAEERRLARSPESQRLQSMVNAKQTVISIDDVLAAAPKNAIAVKATSDCRLEEITMCYSKGPGNLPGSLVPCPQHVLQSARNSGARRCEKLFLGTSCARLTTAMQELLGRRDSRKSAGAD